MESLRIFLLLFTIIAFVSCSPKSRIINSEKDTLKIENQKIKETKKYIISDSLYLVSKITDGDTFSVYYPENKQSETIRPIGIDAPESRNSFKEKKQCYGIESAQYLKGLISGKKVRLVLDQGRYDRNHRTLAYVFLEDSTFVNADLIKNGLADTMNYAPNLKYKELFLNLRNEAKENKRGMWGACF